MRAKNPQVTRLIKVQVEKKNRSPEELEVARSKVRNSLNRKDGETDEQFEARVNRYESNKYSNRNKTIKTQRSPEEIAAGRDKVRLVLPKREGETDQQYERRVKARETYVWQQRGDKDSVDYTPLKRNPWEIVKNVDKLREFNPKLPHESMQEWTDRLTVAESGQYKYSKKNSNYIPKHLKEGTEVVPKIIIDSVRSNDPWDGIENKKKIYE